MKNSADMRIIEILNKNAIGILLREQKTNAISERNFCFKYTKTNHELINVDI